MTHGSLYRQMTGTQMDYAPLSKAAVKRILDYDSDAGFGPGGTMPNRNRFYLYLTQRGSDVQIRTVAVKAANRSELPVVKEVALASVDDPWIHIRDLAFWGMAGYLVDWSREGFSEPRGWDYGGRWEAEAYGLRCMWKINAPVINPELLKRSRRFRWSAWEPKNGYILDYLKVYTAHPEIEFLAKRGLGRLCTKVSVLRKLKTDRKFRQFFGRNADAIKRDVISVPVIMKAYGKGISFAEASREINARHLFRHCGLPRAICAVKALAYMERYHIRMGAYTEYLHDCEELGLDLLDTKVAFPKRFQDRRRIVEEQADAVRRKRSEAKLAEMNARIASMAEEWSFIEQKRGGYRLVIPRAEKDLIAEGRAMANCLGQPQYAAKIARGDFLVVFVRQQRRPAEAFVAVEYDIKRGLITQCYGAKNGKPPKQVRDFVKRVFNGVTAGRMEAAA